MDDIKGKEKLEEIAKKTSEMEEWDKGLDDLITMSSEAYAEEMKRVVPGLLHIITDAIKEGRPIKVKVKRPSIVVSKDDKVEGVPDDGRIHVLQSRIMDIRFTVDTGKQVVSK